MACSVSKALGSADIGEWWETEPFRASSKIQSKGWLVTLFVSVASANGINQNG